MPGRTRNTFGVLNGRLEGSPPILRMLVFIKSLATRWKSGWARKTSPCRPGAITFGIWVFVQFRGGSRVEFLESDCRYRKAKGIDGRDFNPDSLLAAEALLGAAEG